MPTELLLNWLKIYMTKIFLNHEYRDCIRNW
mgnify:CR=1 FL=1